MKEKHKKSYTPPAMHDTIRQEIITALLEGPCSARELSAAAGIPEREVPLHLEHIRKSITSSGHFQCKCSAGNNQQNNNNNDQHNPIFFHVLSSRIKFVQHGCAVRKAYHWIGCMSSNMLKQGETSAASFGCIPVDDRI